MDGGEGFVLISSWHLSRMRDLPPLLLRARRLERECRARPGCRFVHRWVSRRSVMLESHWQTMDALEAWLASAALRQFERRALLLPGACARSLVLRLADRT